MIIQNPHKPCINSVWDQRPGPGCNNVRYQICWEIYNISWGGKRPEYILRSQIQLLNIYLRVDTCDRLNLSIRMVSGGARRKSAPIAFWLYIFHKGFLVSRPDAPTSAIPLLPPSLTSTHSSMSKIDKFYDFLGVPRPFDPEHVFVTSPFFSPLSLSIHRGIRASYTIAVMLVSIIHEGIDGSERAWFTYLTHFKYISLSFYFLFSALHTYEYWRTGYSPLSRRPRFLQCLHKILYSSLTVFPPIMTVLFWAVISDDSTFETTYI